MNSYLEPSPKKIEYVVSKADINKLKSLYDIDSTVLGSGSYAKIFKATNKKD